MTRFVRRLVVALVCTAAWVCASSAHAYEDRPFRFSATVSDSVLMLFRGEILQEFTVEYFADDPELYINGLPLYGETISPKGADCIDYFRDNSVALALFESGLSCSKVSRLVKSMKNEILWDFAEWLEEPGRVADCDSSLVLELQRLCRESPISAVIEGAEVVDGQPCVKFADGRYCQKGVLVSERPEHGSWHKPFRENAFDFASKMVSVAEADRQVSVIFGLRGYKIGGPGMASKGRSQLARMRATGEYVDGPIHRALTENFEFLSY